MCLSGFSVVPLSSLSTPEFAKDLITKQRSRINEKIKSGLLPPGLKEQYEIQLNELEKQTGGDVELTCFPKWFFGGKHYSHTSLLSVNHLAQQLLRKERATS